MEKEKKISKKPTREITTSTEWIENAVHSYVEEVRLAALSFINGASKKKQDEVLDVMISAIEDQTSVAGDFKNRVGTNGHLDVLGFEDVNESEIDKKYLNAVTKTCLEYRRELLRVLRAMSRVDRLVNVLSLSASVLLTIENMRFGAQDTTGNYEL